MRRDLAMTGEITLRGRVWPITGLKEKLLAALRGGIKTVLIPEENAKDLVEIAESIKGGLDIVPVSRMQWLLLLRRSASTNSARRRTHPRISPSSRKITTLGIARRSSKKADGQ